MNSISLSEKINSSLARRAMNLNFLLNANQGCSKVNILNFRGKKLYNGVNTF